MQASSHGLLLAIKDITSQIYKHASISDDFGHVGQGKKQRGILLNSTLVFSPKYEQIVGIIEQSSWSRDIRTIG